MPLLTEWFRRQLNPHPTEEVSICSLKRVAFAIVLVFWNEYPVLI